jgi:subtilisin family serine protease
VVADFDALPDRPVSDRDHGTSVAGIVAGHGPYRGVAPGARLYHARAFENGSSTLDALLTAMEWAIEQDVRIINMSFTGPRNDLFELACRLAGARGIVLVAAAGNAGPGAPFAFPAAYNGVIAVTATNESDGLMEQANRGPYVHVAAPGVDLLAPVAGGTDAVTGTSFAAPVVTGVIANLVREAPGRTPAEIAELLARTAVDLGPPGRDDDFGYGLVNARSAVAGLP